MSTRGMGATGVGVALEVAERIRVAGVVQGVGFRPYVYRLATELGLGGFVGNDGAGVFIEIIGPSDRVDRFAELLPAAPPPLVRIDRIDRFPAVEPTVAPIAGSGPSTGPGRFVIVESRHDRPGQTLVPPDTAVCDDCLAELFDPTDRRYRHPFITCTNCGPRFTIVTDLPYDRPNTTMARFELCPACATEYRDPGDRRYHAQPLACPACGPRLRFEQPVGVVAEAGDPVMAAAAVLTAGGVVAIKGLGGFHLACLASDDAALAELRRRKHRPDKPFAVMVSSLDQARELAEVTAAEASHLLSPARPIVLSQAGNGDRLSALVAPGNPLIGLLLPYTPLHHLLLAAVAGPLVMTSGNRAGEPICHRDGEVAERLGPLVDAVLSHDRPIAVPCDDSVVRLVGEVLLPIRRARGYAPIPVDLPPVRSGGRPPTVLAVGGELKNTFALAVGDHIWVSQHLGDMENLDTLDAFEANVARFRRLYASVGSGLDVVVADAHPGYLSSGWARRHHGDRLLEVQHHHAHIGAVMAEHRLDPERKVVGFAFDGTGYGCDGTVWGGEVLLADATSAQRVAHLAPIRLPGGDAAVHNPYRVALAHLHGAGIEWSQRLAPVAALAPGEGALLARQLERGVACVTTTSMGRLFDAVASLLGLRHRISYEAQAAIDLESAADRARRHGRLRPGGPYRFAIDGPVLDPGPVLADIVTDLTAEVAVEAIALAFHHAVAHLVVAVALGRRAEGPIEPVVLSGGVFQNALLTQACLDRFRAEGIEVHTHQLVPANDGGLSLGQAYIAAHQRSHPDAPVLAVSPRIGADHRNDPEGA